MHDLDVGELELGSGCLHPIEPAAVCVDQGERRRWIDDGQGEAGQPCARSKVGPALF
jgi:hypothetical protein